MTEPRWPDTIEERLEDTKDAHVAELEADFRRQADRNVTLCREVARLREALDWLDRHSFLRNPDAQKVYREALTGGGREPPWPISSEPIPEQDIQHASSFVQEQGWVDNPVYPRGLDGTDGLEDGHWAVEVGERGEQTGATWESANE